MDAGSTGVRVHIFEWHPRLCNFTEPPATLIPRPVALHAVQRPLTSADPEVVSRCLEPLVEFAKTTLSERQSHWHQIPVYLLATAGVRRQRPEQREQLVSTVREFLRQTPFLFESDFVRILSGEEEGAFGWLALNAEVGGLERPAEESVGVLDLGGASFQITFVPQDGQVMQSSFPVMLGGRQTNLYSASYLQFGVRVAQRLLQRKLIAQNLMAEITPDLEHPCLPRGMNYSEVLIGDEEDSLARLADQPLKAVWRGNGDYSECFAQITKLFSKGSSCYNPPCTFSGRYQPRLQQRRFVAFSTFSWVVSALALPPGTTTLEDIEQAAKYVCKMEWSTLRSRWHDLAEVSVRTLCFAATYIVALLHVGLGFDKNSQRIDFRAESVSGNTSWAFGAIIWETNLRFNPGQPLCLQTFPARARQRREL